MNIFKWTPITMILLIGVSCAKEPTASFTVDKPKPTIGSDITFTNTSVDAESYVWTFGDGGVSNIDSPVYDYEEPGTYEVTLKAVSKRDKFEDESTTTVKVLPKDYSGKFLVTVDETTSSCGDNSFSYDMRLRSFADVDSMTINGFAGRFDDIKASYNFKTMELVNRVTSGASDENGNKFEVYTGVISLSDDGNGIELEYRMLQFDGNEICGSIYGTGKGIRQ